MTAPTPSPGPVKRSKRLYVYWGVALTLLVTLGLVCWTVVIPYFRVRRVVMQKSTFGPDGCRAAIQELGGPTAAAGNLTFYLRLPAWTAPNRHVATYVLCGCGEEAVLSLRGLLRDEDPVVARLAQAGLEGVRYLPRLRAELGEDWRLFFIPATEGGYFEGRHKEPHQVLLEPISSMLMLSSPRSCFAFLLQPISPEPRWDQGLGRNYHSYPFGETDTHRIYGGVRAGAPAKHAKQVNAAVRRALGVDWGPRDDNLRCKVELPRKRFMVGEEVFFTLTVQNISTRQTTIYCGPLWVAIRKGLVIELDHMVCYGPSPESIPGMRTTNGILDPGEKRQWQLPLHAWRDPLRPGKGILDTPGKHELRCGYCYHYDGHGSREAPKAVYGCPNAIEVVAEDGESIRRAVAEALKKIKAAEQKDK